MKGCNMKKSHSIPDNPTDLDDMYRKYISDIMNKLDYKRDILLFSSKRDQIYLREVTPNSLRKLANEIEKSPVYPDATFINIYNRGKVDKGTSVKIVDIIQHTKRELSDFTLYSEYNCYIRIFMEDTFNVKIRNNSALILFSDRLITFNQMIDFYKKYSR
jgi:hypothetical protein